MYYPKPETRADLDTDYEWRGQIQLFDTNHKTVELKRSQRYNRWEQHNMEAYWEPWAYSEVSLF